MSEKPGFVAFCRLVRKCFLYRRKRRAGGERKNQFVPHPNPLPRGEGKAFEGLGCGGRASGIADLIFEIWDLADAHVAQSVERVLGKDEVISSILIMGSTWEVKVGKGEGERVRQSRVKSF